MEKNYANALTVIGIALTVLAISFVIFTVRFDGFVKTAGEQALLAPPGQAQQVGGGGTGGNPGSGGGTGGTGVNTGPSPDCGCGATAQRCYLTADENRDICQNNCDIDRDDCYINCILEYNPSCERQQGESDEDFIGRCGYGGSDDLFSCMTLSYPIPGMSCAENWGYCYSDCEGARTQLRLQCSENHELCLKICKRKRNTLGYHPK